MDISGSSFGLHYTSYYSGNEAGSFGLRGGEFNTNTAQRIILWELGLAHS